MKQFVLSVAVFLRFVSGSPLGVGQAPLEEAVWRDHPKQAEVASGKLHGRFLHITDLHADPFYKLHSSTTAENTCHRGSGSAGTYGAETSDCDSPFSLINETFKWIEANLRNKIDFVVWTGDSARHDSDEEIPRNQSQVLGTNKFISSKFKEVFGTRKEDKGIDDDLIIPIVPNFGNNDILPHNIMVPGPNNWLRKYSDIWQMYIPEEQRHGFERGGWFYVEVIPKKLAVFSLNTLYFFDSNTAVDGCALKSEPGFEHMEWLRIQLGFMRDRGMKAILMGHVPPARTSSKQLWDESCWQKYTLWLQQYRDVVITGLYGHMNVDHFILQDTRDIDLTSLRAGAMTQKPKLRDLINVKSATDYLGELRTHWAKLPKVPTFSTSFDTDKSPKKGKKDEKGKKGKKGKKSKKDKALKKIGGPWGERYQMTSISPSIVPNFFPTLRVIEYNITGLGSAVTWQDRATLPAWQTSPESSVAVATDEEIEELESLIAEYGDESNKNDEDSVVGDFLEGDEKSKKTKKKKPKKPKHPNLTIPPPPSKGTPPGPAYSPQTLSLLGYTQYFANLTHINNDYNHDGDENDKDIDNHGWHEGKHKNKPPKEKNPHPKTFKYEVEYRTLNDTTFRLKDMTVKSYLKLARKIGKYSGKQASFAQNSEMNIDHITEKQDGDKQDDSGNFSSWIGKIFDKLSGTSNTEHMEVHNERAPKQRPRYQKKNKIWIAFLRRAFVGTMSDEELKNFEAIADEVGATLHESIAEEL